MSIKLSFLAGTVGAAAIVVFTLLTTGSAHGAGVTLNGSGSTLSKPGASCTGRLRSRSPG